MYIFAILLFIILIAIKKEKFFNYKKNKCRSYVNNNMIKYTAKNLYPLDRYKFKQGYINPDNLNNPKFIGSRLRKCY